MNPKAANSTADTDGLISPPSPPQELEKMARGLNLSDEQQRAFMLKASMKKLSSATTLPSRKRKTPVEEAVDDRVFASEKGFLKNSKVTWTGGGFKR